MQLLDMHSKNDISIDLESLFFANCKCTKFKVRLMGHVNEFPTMHYFVIPKLTQSMIAYKILTEYFWKFQ